MTLFKIITTVKPIVNQSYSTFSYGPVKHYTNCTKSNTLLAFFHILHSLLEPFKTVYFHNIFKQIPLLLLYEIVKHTANQNYTHDKINGNLNASYHSVQNIFPFTI
jgi:hypothetical protein